MSRGSRDYDSVVVWWGPTTGLSGFDSTFVDNVEGVSVRLHLSKVDGFNFTKGRTIFFGGIGVSRRKGHGSDFFMGRRILYHGTSGSHQRMGSWIRLHHGT